jgi:hypothetical protein
MKRSLNFGSIFRRKEDQPPPPAGDQTDHALLTKRLSERIIKLERGDLEPASSAAPPLDWEAVDGHLSVLGSAIEGILDGRARIKAASLKALSPSALTADAPDQSEYIVSLPALIRQIQDLLGPSEPESVLEPEYETPFTILAKEDETRLARRRNGQKKEEPREQPSKALDSLPPADVSAPDAELFEEVPRREDKETKDERQDPDLVIAEPPVLTLRTLRPGPANRTENKPENTLEGQGHTTHQEEIKTDDGPRLPEPEHSAEGQIKLFEMTTVEEPFVGESAVTPVVSARWDGDSSPAGRGMGLLQEIFMTSEPLDGRRVASLVRQFPGVTGALILLRGGAVVGGQLPESLNMDAALQAPEVLTKFLRFIHELEGESVAPRFVTVTSANTISLVSCGQVVLLVSHQGRKLPPGLSQRLTETAQALDLFYGKNT